MPLWPHQERGLKELTAIRTTATSPPAICFTAPTGAGKTKCLSEIILNDVAAGKKVILYTNRRLLLEQTSKVLDSHSIAYGMRAAGHDDARIEQHRAVPLPGEGVAAVHDERDR
jgi:superfamily II DNA or RNA helicase